MKFRVAFFILLFNINFIIAQNYIQFPDSNATWTSGVYFMWGFQNDTIYSYYKTGGTTLINDTLYTVIDLPDYESYCFLREENRKVYCRYNGDSPEFILYNFNLAIGDTISLPHTFVGLTYQEGFVYNIDSLLIGEKYHKRYYVFCWDWLSFEFIEGIGSAQGLMYCELPWVDWYGNLECFSSNDTMFSTDGSGSYLPGNCWLYIIVNEAKQESVAIYPNPTNDKIFIKCNQNYYIEIIDILGTRRTLGSSAKLNFKEYPEGLYIIKVYSEENHLIKHAKILKTNTRY